MKKAVEDNASQRHARNSARTRRAPSPQHFTLRSPLVKDHDSSRRFPFELDSDVDHGHPRVAVEVFTAQLEGRLDIADGTNRDRFGWFEFGHDFPRRLAFANEVRALGNSNVQAEVSFLNGNSVRYGTPGSVRLDAVQFGPNNQVLNVFDLKTGSATLTPQRILQIQQQVGSPVPVNLLRP